MSMEIGSNYNGYASYYSTSNANSVKKASSKKDNTSVKESSVTTSTVELKTSTPGKTRTEQIKTGYSNVNDYSKYLQSKYSYMNTGTTSMQGVPTTVSVSSAFLKKCMNDPEKAAYLEENLAALPNCASYAVSHAKGTLTSLSYKIDENGNITGISSGTNDPDGRIARENAERKAKESREKAEKAEKKRAAKRAEAEKAEKKRIAKRAEEKQVSNETSAKQTEENIVVSKGDVKTPEKTSAYITQAINIGSNFNSYS